MDGRDPVLQLDLGVGLEEVDVAGGCAERENVLFLRVLRNRLTDAVIHICKGQRMQKVRNLNLRRVEDELRVQAGSVVSSMAGCSP